MASWADLVKQVESLHPQARGQWVLDQAKVQVGRLATLTNQNVIFYASGFLQKPQVAGQFLSITAEDINGFMTCIHGMDCSKGLLLLLHTPGGSPDAAATIVSYLWSKFTKIEVLIPTYAMSAGTMIAMAGNNIIMGRQSQLGPTDPQLIMNNMPHSAHSIVEQFDEAKKEIANSPQLAGAWLPILQPFGPALLQTARKAIAYTQQLVTQWLEQRMLAGEQNAATTSKAIAEHLGGAQHGSHGRRIDREAARALGLKVTDLEGKPELQDSALTLYHLATVAFEQGPMSKMMISTNGNQWIKNVPAPPAMQLPIFQMAPAAVPGAVPPNVTPIRPPGSTP
jgi:Serine dehydrogenase proteinase